MKENKSTGSFVTPHRDELVSSSEARETLLPCPFCGDEAEVTSDAYGTAWAASCCTDIDPNCAGGFEPVYFSRVFAIAAWNRRALVQQSPAAQGGEGTSKPLACEGSSFPMGREEVLSALASIWSVGLTGANVNDFERARATIERLYDELDEAYATLKEVGDGQIYAIRRAEKAEAENARLKAWRFEVSERLGFCCAAGATWTPDQIWEGVRFEERKTETRLEKAEAELAALRAQVTEASASPRKPSEASASDAQSEAPLRSGEAVAWQWEQRLDNGRLRIMDSDKWEARVGFNVPNYEDRHLWIRNVRPLVYTAPAPQAEQGAQELPHIRARAQEVADEWDCDADLILAAFNKLLPCYLSDPSETHLTVPVDSLIRSDDYGVYGSTFYECRLCDAASGAGVLNKGIPHRADCPLHESNGAALAAASPAPDNKGS